MTAEKSSERKSPSADQVKIAGIAALEAFARAQNLSDPLATDDSASPIDVGLAVRDAIAKADEFAGQKLEVEKELSDAKRLREEAEQMMADARPVGEMRRALKKERLLRKAAEDDAEFWKGQVHDILEADAASDRDFDALLRMAGRLAWRLDSRRFSGIGEVRELLERWPKRCDRLGMVPPMEAELDDEGGYVGGFPLVHGEDGNVVPDMSNAAIARWWHLSTLTRREGMPDFLEDPKDEEDDA